MTWIELTGHLGALLSCITFIPQVYKTWKTRSAGDISLAMLLIVFTSTIVWLVYAFALMLWPVIVANVIMCILCSTLIGFKFAFAKKA
jgi:MtN3 and saliva related transmembrane protein